MREWSGHREVSTNGVVVPCQATAPAVCLQDLPCLNNARTWTRDQLLTTLAVSPRLGIDGNAVAKDHFAALPAGEQGNADDDRRQAQPVGQHAGPAITLPIARCQASPGVRMRSSHMMAFGNDSGANQIIQLLHASSRAPGANRH
jgi:hypothetical protein